nr:DNA-directed RNA polymerase subunit omega [Nannocystis sp.]
MARVTVEDCLEKIPNRFALTILAARRARALLESRGTPMVQCENKGAVIALREISAGAVRYTEDVDTVMVDFIEEQRLKLKLTSSDNTFLEAAAFSVIEGEDSDEEGDIIPELSADFEKVGLAPTETTDSDEPVDVEDADTEEEAAVDDEEAELGAAAEIDDAAGLEDLDAGLEDEETETAEVEDEE